MFNLHTNGIHDVRRHPSTPDVTSPRRYYYLQEIINENWDFISKSGQVA